MKKRIVARCKLLLEVRLNEHNKSSDILALYSGSYVTFLHRTVRDYLREREAQDLLTLRFKTPFDPRREICNGLLAQIKSDPRSSAACIDDERASYKLVLQFMHQAIVFEHSEQKCLGAFLNQLEITMQTRAGPHFQWWQDSLRREVTYGTPAFLFFVLQHRLSHYLDWRFEASPPKSLLTSTQMAMILNVALEPLRSFDHICRRSKDLAKAWLRSKH
jgi:hypothetical protein